MSLRVRESNDMYDRWSELAGKVSIVVPVYNTAPFLSRCLDSLIGQSYAELEIICVDDGSTDDSAVILDSYRRRDARIHVVFQENRGLSGARNTGLDLVSGTYVMFVDSDDYLPLFAVGVFVRVAAESQADVVVSDRLESVSSGRTIRPVNAIPWVFHTAAIRDVLRSRGSASSACNKLYRAEVVCGRRFFEGISFEDWPFVAMLFGTIRSYASISLPLYYYDDTNISIVRSPFSVRKIESYMIGIRLVHDFYKNRAELRFVKVRLSVAVKMCVNKVFRDKDRNSLFPVLCSEVRRLVADGILRWRDLPIKTLFRLLLMGLGSRA